MGETILYASNPNTDNKDISARLDWNKLDSFYSGNRIYYKIPFTASTIAKNKSLFLVIRKNKTNSQYEAALLTKNNEGTYSVDGKEYTVPMQIYLSIRNGEPLSIYKKELTDKRFVAFGTSASNSLTIPRTNGAIMYRSPKNNSIAGSVSKPVTLMSTSTTKCYEITIPGTCYASDGPNNEVICTNSRKKNLCITTPTNNNEDTYKDEIIDETGGGWDPDPEEEDEEEEFYKIKLDTSLKKNPCLDSVVTRILFSGNNSPNILNNFIEKLGFSKTVNLNVNLSQDRYELDQYVVARTESGNTSIDGSVISKDFTITFYQPTISSSTQLYTASYMFHEIAHAYIEYDILKSIATKNTAKLNQTLKDLGAFIDVDRMIRDFNKNGLTSEFGNTLLREYNAVMNLFGHEIMASRYISVIGDAISGFDGNRFDISYYNKLAYAGLQHNEIAGWKNADSTFKVAVSSALQLEEHGDSSSLGKKCIN
ncbi:MAG: hypothetical protein DI598_16555 [Pseudopedobacter saltans]|uniref:Uncharacterized protein n=1 Tax=Pseudopedobacter saltans TaxID=151895 RepID=A0A2W5GHH3_9SPHI|nr:MAG: hypothetical protein DI598_16555 [Pseudopedobacter saltans]